MKNLILLGLGLFFFRHSVARVSVCMASVRSVGFAMSA
jgi:hypothetical protein